MRPWFCSVEMLPQFIVTHSSQLHHLGPWLCALRRASLAITLHSYLVGNGLCWFRSSFLSLSAGIEGQGSRCCFLHSEQPGFLLAPADRALQNNSCQQHHGVSVYFMIAPFTLGSHTHNYFSVSQSLQSYCYVEIRLLQDLAFKHPKAHLFIWRTLLGSVLILSHVITSHLRAAH